jgi:hypothetical protein
MKPTPAKPKIIIVQVEGSGAASKKTDVIVPVNLLIPDALAGVTTG